ncbi:mechanosensitive ion channel domain-containing protein [Trichlorobacter thiogenes]|nr:mechanosensitive ion channel domain-containing protein [Trichlorobacter thiogenes]
MGLAVVLMSVATCYSAAFAPLPKQFTSTQADTQESKTATKAITPEQQIEIARRALTKAQSERDQALAASEDSSRQEVQERNRLLDGLVTRFGSQLSLIDEREELRRARVVADQKTKSWSGFHDPPPYSILVVDELMGSVLAARSRSQGLSTNQDLLASQIAHYREAAKQVQERERQAADELEHAQTPEQRLTAAWQKELAALRTRNADALSGLLALRYEVIGERLGIAGVERELLERQLAEARKKVVFSQADLDKTIARLKSERVNLEQELDASLVRDARSRTVLAGIKRNLEKGALLQGTIDGTSVLKKMQRDRLEAEQRAAVAWVESSRFETEVISALIATNKSTSSFWEKRYAALTGKNLGKLRAILVEFRTSVEQLKPWLLFAQQQLELYQAAERAQKLRLFKIDKKNVLNLAELDLLAAIRLQRELAERQKVAVEHAYSERQAWLEEMERVQHAQTITDRTWDWFGTFPNILGHIWRFELFAIEDSVEVAGQKVITSRGVTVGKSVGAILLFLVGYMIALFSGHKVQRIMVTRFRVGEHQANVIRRWLLALTVFILMIITLNLARIPLTVFAFLGGALAIGVGFGTQTLIKNFISGILILLERNVKVGDTIEVDGVVGRIVTVDIRASTVLGFDGVETVIPNAMFLENKVTNWTHTNASLRRTVKVGVAYGSSLTRVRDILVESAREHGLILKNPPPEALLDDFGDSSLVFILYFWIDYSAAVNPLIVASDLRFMIDKRFGEEQIIFAFPQCDIHLDRSEPLRVQVVPTPAVP